MSGNALPFVGNCYVYLNTIQIPTKCQIQTYMPFCDFFIQIHTISVFKYKYEFEPNPEHKPLQTETSTKQSMHGCSLKKDKNGHLLSSLLLTKTFCFNVMYC